MINDPLSSSLFNQSQEQIPREKRKKESMKSKHNNDMAITVQII